jgi:tRNA pseudouridine38-40 synthase
MQKFKIIVAYDGTDYFGWQIQPSDITVVSVLQNTFARLFGREIRILGASRTDAGVHALGQAAQFHTDLAIDTQVMMDAWNRSLPRSIVIRSLEQVSNLFHPHAHVRQKVYYYHLFLKQPLPFVARFGWYSKFIDAVDWLKFEKGLLLYRGEHDFASFCRVEDKHKSTVRRIDDIRLERLSRWGAARVVVKGPGFLRFQIRRMVGYALDVARRPDVPLDFLHEVMEQKNPQQNLLKADSSGLCLRKVIYDESDI